MERVTGIGGVFIRVKDPTALSKWYADHLGIPIVNGSMAIFASPPNASESFIWSLHPNDTDYFGPARPSFMINYRVANLDRMLEQLRNGGVVVEKTEDSDYGRFAWVTDPEGNRIELWEPKVK